MDIGQTTLAVMRAQEQLEPGQRVEVSRAGNVLITRAPAASPHALLWIDKPTRPSQVMHQLREAVERIGVTVTPPNDWTPDWNLATIPDAALHSEAARRRASKRTYTRQARPVERQSVSE